MKATQAWWPTSVIPVLFRRWGLENCEFHARSTFKRIQGKSGQILFQTEKKKMHFQGKGMFNLIYT
jgi:hypothetical protein